MDKHSWRGACVRRKFENARRSHAYCALRSWFKFVWPTHRYFRASSTLKNLFICFDLLCAIHQHDSMTQRPIRTGNKKSFTIRNKSAVGQNRVAKRLNKLMVSYSDAQRPRYIFQCRFLIPAALPHRGAARCHIIDASWISSPAKNLAINVNWEISRSPWRIKNNNVEVRCFQIS